VKEGKSNCMRKMGIPFCALGNQGSTRRSTAEKALFLNGNISGNGYIREDVVISSDFNEILFYTL